MSAAVAVHPVTNSQELRKFIDVPWLFLGNHPLIDLLLLYKIARN